MALDLSEGFVPANGGVSDLEDLPIFTVERVQLQFSVAAGFSAAQVANNVIVLALTNGRILRIDLNRPEDIDDIDLPRSGKSASSTDHQGGAGGGVIRRMFLDPTASHLIVCTVSGENYYLHSQSRQPRPLSRLRGVPIESVAWNPELPTASTREILLGAADGNIYEASIETSTDFYKKEVKQLKNLHRLPDGPVTGLWVDNLPGGSGGDVRRRVLIATHGRLFHLSGKVGPSRDGSGSIYTRLFEGEQPVVHELSRSSSSSSSTAAAGHSSSLAVSPDPPVDADDARGSHPLERAYAWLTAQGVFHGKLLLGAAEDGSSGNGSDNLGARVFSESKMLPRAQIVAPEGPERRGGGGRTAPPSEAIEAIALTQWHMISLVGGRVVATNRLTGQVVSEHDVLGAGQQTVGFSVDLQKNTFWLFTSDEIFEIVVRDEDRNIWEILMKQRQFEPALRHARTQSQKETVAAAYGDHLAGGGHWGEAAVVYGRSNKPFEDIALGIMDSGQPDALRRFLLTRLAATSKSSVMQRMMLAGWLVEVFMAKLNSLDDAIGIGAQAEMAAAPGGAGGSNGNSSNESRKLLGQVRGEFREFVTRYRADLDVRTAYDVISSHGREEELLYFADAVGDYNYVLSYWVQRERWAEALGVLKRQTDRDVFYRYSSVLMTHVPQETVEVLMRHPDLEPRRLIPALLEYNAAFSGGPTSQNQAIRYLNYLVYQVDSRDPAVHNTLVSMYASHPSRDESGLLSYLQAQGDNDSSNANANVNAKGGGGGGPDVRYDPDFALRLCIQHHRTLSCVHIYTSMGQYLQAVDLALSHNEVDLAAVIADRPTSNPTLRKRLWLAVARKVISQTGDGIRTAIEFAGRCELIRIEDLIPFFPDFVVIDDFKEEICSALEEYSRSIDRLRRDMDESSATAANIKLDIAALDHRYALVTPGERCYACGLPLVSRQFFVFPCQHSFHSDCLGKRVLEQSGVAKSSRMRDLQMQIHRGTVTQGDKRDAVVAELDSLVASACILCSDLAIKRIDEPFITSNDNLEEWTV
ncbi:vacuolar protein sorting-associated protein 18 [Geosmithia morbida]|uniref:Vacuolar protein sorting-associated protein 18 n=1 Tax=Geosmithia morbida TaxID=1094350 RepID=A0A9P4YU98_9HYPO|nr:vacuolar protein sorting-associated protein 18 [Geosmithia morbida]KAF4123218.1 vacuolar protein sorting-associated protein 18 [Geosmithia morbida]